MLKIVVFDGGFGGELFANQLETEFPVAEILRVIDWRHADQIAKSPLLARHFTEMALRPYIGRVDLIILANHLLTLTSLNYFRKKYKNQRFSGLILPNPDTLGSRPALVFATSALARTVKFQRFLLKLHRPTTIFYLDDWPSLIDDGEMSNSTMRHELSKLTALQETKPSDIILACAHFSDLKPDFKSIYGAKNIRIHDSFKDSIYEAYKVLGIRGRLHKK